MTSSAPPRPAAWPVGGGEMAARIRAHDWAATPLGPTAAWPAALRLAVGAILDSPFPMAVVWGPALTTLYNDAFRPILGDKPEALGRGFDAVWREAWPAIGPLAARALAGEATFLADFPLLIARGGAPERACFTFAYSPLRDEAGAVGGFLDTVVETTGRVRAEAALRASEARLAAEVEALGRLHALSARLVGAPAPAALLAEVLEGTMALQGAALGNIQLYDPATRTLSIAVQRGFAAPFLTRFGTVDAADPTACGRALAGGQRVVIEDVEADAAYAPLRAVAAAAGYRAVQSTPLFGGDGRPVGMLSTHFPRPHRPSDRELRLTDLYMGLAVQLLERAQLAAERERRAVAEAVAAERQALLARVVAAQEEERRRVAHEVHDGVTQLAHAATLRLDALAERLAPGVAPDAADLADLARARDLTRRAAADARRLIAGLRPEALDALGFAEAVRQEVAALRAEGWRADVAAGDRAPGRLSPEAEITLFRVAQEALTNVRKHTGPGVRVRVRLAAAGGRVRLTVQDWGRGFAPAPPGAAGEHVGLVGMRERLALLGGALTVRSAPGRGTTVRATLPLPPPAGGAGAGRSG